MFTAWPIVDYAQKQIAEDSSTSVLIAYADHIRTKEGTIQYCPKIPSY